MDRRAFLIGGAVMAGLARGARADEPVDDLRAAAREAWIYGLPLVEMARLREAAIGARPTHGAPGFNAFAHQRAPLGPADRWLSAPDADMLYSSAWIFLPPEGARIRLPPTGGRFFSLGLFDMYGNAFEVVEGREVGERGDAFDLIGPPAHVGMAGYVAPIPRLPHLIGRVVRAPGRWVWALARIHVESLADLAGAHEIQDGLEIRVKPSQPAPAPPIGLDAAWSDYFYAVQKLIEESPPPSSEMGFFRRIAPLQLGPAGDFERARFADIDLGAVNAGVNEARALVPQTRATEDSATGWMWPKAEIGRYERDFLYRARTVQTLGAALPRETVTPLRAVGLDGALGFASGRHHRLTLPGPPPAAGPWSLTLYELTPDGRLYLSQNPLERHFLGAWSPGLRRRADGDIDIWIGRADPGGARSANWLPAPAEGPFALVLRAYAPTEAVLERRYRPPPVETLGAAAAGQR